MPQSRRLLPLVAAFSLLLAGCDFAPGEDAPRTTITTTITTSAQPEDTTSEEPSEDEASSVEAAALNAYREVIANPEDYPVNPAAQYEPRGGYQYSLVEATSDNTPELLVRVNGMEYSPVLVFSYDSGSETAVQTDDVLIDGAAGAGGGRSRVWASKAGEGLYQVDYHSLRTEAYSSLFHIAGSSLKNVENQVKFNIKTPADDHQPIVWYDTTEPEGFNIVQGAGGAAPGVEEITPYGTANTETEAEVATADGTYRFSGEVVIMTNADLPESPANGEPLDQEHIILTLDSPQEVTAQTPANSHRTATMTQVVLHPYNSDKPIEHSKWMPYVGQHITITSTPEQMSYPSDTTMPLGMLRVRDAVSIN